MGYFIFLIKNSDLRTRLLSPDASILKIIASVSRQLLPVLYPSYVVYETVYGDGGGLFDIIILDVLARIH